MVDGGPFSQNGPNGSGNLILGGRDGGSANFNGCIDEVAIWQEVLPDGAIAAIARPERKSFPPRTPTAMG